jgi:LEA14-like dessication related protein
MANERIPAWWVSHVRNDERTTVRIDASVHSSTLGRSVDLPQRRTVETDLIGQFRSTADRPVNADLPLVSDPVLVIRETDAQWGNVTDRRTPIDASMTVYNPKTVPYVVTEIGYNVTMNGVPVGNGTTDRAHAIPGRSERTVGTTVAIDNRRLDEWWVSHLRNDQVSELRIDFHATVRLPDGSTVRVPLDALTYTETIETDVFGTKNASSNGSTGSSASTATPGGSTTTPETTTGAATAADDTATDGDVPTSDDTPTERDTGTATRTTTTDGGLLDDDTGLLANDSTATESTPTPTSTATGAASVEPTDGGGTSTDDGRPVVGRAVGAHTILNSPVA